MHTWKTKFKPLDRVRWIYYNVTGVILTVEIQRIEEDPTETYLTTYEIFLDGYDPEDPNGLTHVAEKGLEKID